VIDGIGEEEMEDNRIIYKQTWHDTNKCWDRKSIVRSGWRRDGREIESNTSRQSMIKKNSWDGKLTDGSG